LLWIGVILFAWAAFAGSDVFGRSAVEYFQYVVVLGLLELVAMRSCSCCCGDSCCEVCPVKKQV